MKIRDLLKNLDLIDWLLAAAFTALVAFAVNSLVPGYGWLIGIAVAVALLFIAIRKRGRLTR